MPQATGVKIMVHVRLLALALLLLAVPSLVSAAPRADLWEYWQKNDPDSRQSVDHTPWTGFLSNYVFTGKDGINRVDYQAVTSGDRRLLDDYLDRLTQTEVRSLSPDVQMPLWINLYNALTVQLVLDNYPVDSIKDISFGFLSFGGPWKEKLVTVEGKELSLNDIEHRILRPIWKDPRIHYAVNCASLGCPNLQPVAFTAQNTEDLLNKGAREYINHPRGVSVEGGRLVVSSIYDWFQEDFGGDDAGVIEHLMHYARPELQKKLQGFEDIDGDRYDWSLNDG